LNELPSKGSSPLTNITSIEYSKVSLYEVKPVQVDRNHKQFGERYMSVRSYKLDSNGRYFHKSLTAQKLRDALSYANAKEKYSITQNGNHILYQYADKPKIILNLDDGRYYVDEETYRSFHPHQIQLQAYILTEILAKYELSSSKRGKRKLMKTFDDNE